MTATVKSPAGGGQELLVLALGVAEGVFQCAHRQALLLADAAVLPGHGAGHQVERVAQLFG